MKASRFNVVLAVASAAVLAMSAGAWACGDGTDGTRNCGGTVVLGSWPCGAEGADVTCTLWDNGVFTVEGAGRMADSPPPILDGNESPWKFADINHVNIHNGVTYVGSFAFWGMNVSNVAIFSENPPEIGTGAFGSMHALDAYNLYVVAEGSLETYANAPVWKEFGNIQYADKDIALVEGTTSVARVNRISRGNSAARLLTLRGKTLTLSAPANTAYGIRVLDVRGKTVSRFKSSGGGSFSLAKIPAGRYFVEARGGGKVERVAVVVR